MRTFVFLFYTCVLLGVTTQAQNDSLRTRFLDEVVVSASRSEQQIREVPRSISVINRNQIEPSVYNTVGDLLAQQEGVYLVGANQTPGTNQALFLRGANSNQVLVMIDGVRITDPSSPNNAIDLSELSLTQVERIEILKGSHSTLFGSAAVGGVVNIITKTAGQKGLHGSGSLLSGGLGNGASNFAQQADLSYAFGNGLFLNGGVFNQSVSGLNAARDTTTNRLTPPDRDNFKKTDGNLRLGFRNQSLDVFASYKSTFQKADIDQGAFVDDDNNSLHFYRNFWNYGGTYKFNPRWSFKTIGSLSNLRRSNENDSSLMAPGMYDHNYFKGTYHGDLKTHEAQVNYKAKRINAVFGGGQFSERMNFDTYFFSSAFGGFESSTNYDSIDTRASTSYLFGQVIIDAGFDSRLSLTVGGRYSDHTLFGSFFTYEFSPSFLLAERTLLYASYATGFNAASLYQLYDPTGISVTRGNALLKPEESKSVEMGIKKEFDSKSFLTLSLFASQTKNIIEYVYLWNNLTPISSLSFLDYRGDTYINLSGQQVSGVELSGTTSIGKFDFSGNVTLLNGKIKSKPSDLPANQIGANHVQLYANGAFLDSESEQDNLARRPPLTGNAQLTYRYSQALSIYLNYRLAGARFDSVYDPTLGPYGALAPLEVASYSLIDIGTNFNVNKNIQLAASVRNLFDANYQEISGFSTIGRSAYLKAIFKW